MSVAEKVVAFSFLHLEVSLTLFKALNMRMLSRSAFSVLIPDIGIKMDHTSFVSLNPHSQR